MTNLFLTIAALLMVGCNSGKQKDPALIKQPSIIKDDTTHSDTVVLNETFQQEDTAYNEYLADRLKPIRKNFKRINSISRWTSIYKKELDGSTEGGEATCYFSDGVLEKIVSRHFGESFQQLTEYYLLHGQLSFVFEKSYKYNRPIYSPFADDYLLEEQMRLTTDFDKLKVVTKQK